MENDNKEERIINPERIRNFLAIHLNADEEALVDQIILHTPESVRTRTEEWYKQSDGIIYVKNRIFVPETEGLRTIVMNAYHNSIMTGHPGQKRLTLMIAEKFYWENLPKDVMAYVKGCDICQRYKDVHQQPSGKLIPLEVPTRPWTNISMDHIVGLPEAKGCNTILVVVD
jgi:hypothetical protein